MDGQTHTHIKQFGFYLFVLSSISTSRTKDAQKEKQQINICTPFSTKMDICNMHILSMIIQPPSQAAAQYVQDTCKETAKIHFFWDAALLGEQILMSQRTVLPSSLE